MNDILLKAKENMLLKEKELSKYACKSESGIWLKEDQEDIRPIFYREIHRQNTSIFFCTKRPHYQKSFARAISCKNRKNYWKKPKIK